MKSFAAIEFFCCKMLPSRGAQEETQMAQHSVNSKSAALCPRCKGDGAVLTQLPTQTESNYGWAGYVPCPCCGGCGQIFSAVEVAITARHS